MLKLQLETHFIVVAAKAYSINSVRLRRKKACKFGIVNSVCIQTESVLNREKFLNLILSIISLKLLHTKRRRRKKKLMIRSPRVTSLLSIALISQVV